jgi:SAM-dependent methyltransferase
VGATRYVDDVPYERAHIPQLSPAWLDFTALLWGFAPRDRATPLTWCDLGCGQGVTAVLLAATHPGGRFVGIDAMAPHVEHAASLAAAVGATNATFHTADFGAALQLDLPQFDYITAHGVYSWVDDRAREDLLRFVDARLKPGGRVYVSYNALPGRMADQPFQQLLLALSSGFEGDSVERVEGALDIARRLLAVNTAAVVGSPMAENALRARDGRRGVRYLAHEFLNPHWRPLGVGQVRRDFAAIGLTPAGSATLVDNFDSYVLTARARRIVDAIDDPDTREMVRDYLVNASFRRDVFVRDAEELGDDAQAAALLATGFALAHPSREVPYRLSTTAGEITFDTPEARRLVRALADGPRRLCDLPDAADLLPSALALAAAGDIWPVEASAADADAFNRVVADRWGGPDELRLIALACGAAALPPAGVLRALHGPGRGAAAWATHLSRYGAKFRT